MKKLAALLLAALLATAMVGCSKSDSKDDATTETEATESTEKSESSDVTEEEDSSTDSTEDEGDRDINATDVFAAEDCLAVVTGWTTAIGSAMGFVSDEDKAELESTFEELKGEVPDEIADDIQTVADGLNDADGLVEMGEFLDSDEGKEATDNIEAFLDEECGGT